MTRAPSARIGETLNEAIRAYLARPEGMRRDRSLGELEPRSYPPGNDRLSESIDSVLYGS